MLRNFLFKKNVNNPMRLLKVYLQFKSDETKRQYISIYNEFLTFLKITPDKITAIDVSRYITEQSKKHGQKDRLTQEVGLVLNSTIQRKLIILSSIWRYFIANGIVNKNPFDQFIVKQRKSAKRRPTELIPFALVKSILQAPDQSKNGIRDKAILSVLFGLGLRRAEVASLRLGSIVENAIGAKYVRLTQKGGFAVEKNLPDWVFKAIQPLVELRIQEGAQRQDFLFIRNFKNNKKNQNPLSDSSIYRLFKSYCANVGLDYNLFSPHSARATAITKLLIDGADFDQVRQFAGHSSVQTTQIYDKRAKLNSGIALKLDY